MERCGLKPVLSAATFRGAVQLDAALLEGALKRAQVFFHSKACLVPHGLDSLPASWLAGLPGILWAMRKPHWHHLPYMIDRIGCSEGVMILGFAQETESRDSRMTAWDSIRVTVNRQLYPSRWRPLLRRHRLQILGRWPNLPRAGAQDLP
jgi:hypothetical protein